MSLSPAAGVSDVRSLVEEGAAGEEGDGKLDMNASGVEIGARKTYFASA